MWSSSPLVGSPPPAPAHTPCQLWLLSSGPGAVSNWRLHISDPKVLESLSDVVVTLRYTARDGGEDFRRDVENLGKEPEKAHPQQKVVAVSVGV